MSGITFHYKFKFDVTHIIRTFYFVSFDLISVLKNQRRWNLFKCFSTIEKRINYLSTKRQILKIVFRLQDTIMSKFFGSVLSHHVC